MPPVGYTLWREVLEMRSMLELNYTLSEKDFLYLQLYMASNDEASVKQRRKEKYRIIGLSLLFGIILLFDESYRYYSYFFIGSALIFFLIYPWWSRWFYKRMYKKQIENQLKGDFPYPTKLFFSDTVIDVESKKGITRFTVSDIQTIIEIKGYFIITMNKFVSIIIPKEYVEDSAQITNIFRQYSNDAKIAFIQDLDWKWQ